VSIKPQADKVNMLVEAALVGMESTGEDFTGKEFLSAVFTLTLRAVKSTLLKSPETLPTIKQALEVLLMECVPTGKVN
jgi:hypothetical protein